MVADFGCVHPLRDPGRAPDAQGESGIPCTATATYLLTDVAAPPRWRSSVARSRTRPRNSPHTVPDPYYVASAFERTTETR